MFKSKKIKFFRLKALQKCPQKSGTVTKVFVTTPKKPNSALRKLVKARLSNFRKMIAHVPGENHKLLKFSHILCRGCRVRDTPGIKYRVIRNAYGYNLKGINWRVKGRSKYGAKKTPKLPTPVLTHFFSFYEIVNPSDSIYFYNIFLLVYYKYLITNV